MPLLTWRAQLYLAGGSIQCIVVITYIKELFLYCWVLLSGITKLFELLHMCFFKMFDVLQSWYLVVEIWRFCFWNLMVSG